MNTPSAEALIVIRNYDPTTQAWGEWRDSLEFDPIDLPVEDHTDGTAPIMTDVFNSNVIGLVNALLEADDDGHTERMLVWSDSRNPVKGNCPVCDDVFPIAEGAPGDELNEGYDAVWCGCDPADLNEDGSERD
jgi:hypothetical protein